MKWPKTLGVIIADYVGYWLDWKHFRVGISQRRAEWLIDWTTQVLTHGFVEMEEFGSVLGRWSCVAQILENDRPFWGPLFAWSAAAPRRGVLALPLMVGLALKWLAHTLRRRSTIDSREMPDLVGAIFMTDAEASREAMSLGIGGWRCAGGVATKDAKWFSLH